MTNNDMPSEEGLGNGRVAVTRHFNDVAIGQRADGYLNATAMCKAARKKWNDYSRQDGSDAFLNALSAKTGIPVIERNQGLVQSRQGTGTWVHPQVAYHLAQWCSPAFAVQVTEWIHDIRTQGYATAPGVEMGPLTAKETGGIIKAVVNKALMERVEPLERAMIETARQVQELSHRVDDLLLATNGRVAAVEYVSVRQLLDEAKAIQKGRNSINRKIGRELRDRACLRHPPIPVRKCPHSGVWLFPVDFAAAYMKERGSALVADHNAKAGGQGVIRFPTRRKKPGQPEPDGNRPGA